MTRTERSEAIFPLLIVPARAGSRRIPNKNVRPINGLSPYRRAINVCKQIPNAEVLVTADFIPKDEVYDGVFYYHRKPELASDSASMVDVVLDVLRWHGGPPDQRVLVVQPTQPLREAKHLQKALTMLEHASSVASVVETLSVDKLYRIRDRRPLPIGQSVERDQDGEPTYTFDGTVYGFKRDWFLEHRAFKDPEHTVVFVIPPEETTRLDTLLEWDIACLRMQHATSHA